MTDEQPQQPAVRIGRMQFDKDQTTAWHRSHGVRERIRGLARKAIVRDKLEQVHVLSGGGRILERITKE